MLDPARIDDLIARLAAADPEQNRPPAAKMGRAPFESLMGVMLSAQSRDAMTAKAKRQLLRRARTPEAILDLDETEIAALIKDCGLYNTKARNLKRMSAALLERHGGVVPRTREALMALPGVGRKCADIMLRFVFGEPEVPVDTHVFRVARRTGLAAGRTEAAVAIELADRIPERWRWGAHMWLLNHGKRVCRARAPACDRCGIADLCERNGVSGPG
ncbi:MAG: endonuclease III [Geminicoccaceae bacterium]|jgi:endonuclease-3|nr:endonuclease III [Geminicoccaceae bacterium]MCB9968612.1 endonuclease III [Geminicoccaceae bacterium]HRY23168.1 endonuclease III [Geminicoccaceae bacterium]